MYDPFLAAEKKNIRVGLKDVQKHIRRGEKGLELKFFVCKYMTFLYRLLNYLYNCFYSLVVFGADVTPIDIMCHMPAVCEEKEIPYCYVPSREDLGHAAGLHRTAVMALILKDNDYEELYTECEEIVKQLPLDI